MLPAETRLLMVIRLRSRGDSSGRDHTCPNSTSSVSDTNVGAKSPIIFCIGVCSTFSDICFYLLEGIGFGMGAGQDQEPEQGQQRSADHEQAHQDDLPGWDAAGQPG